MSKTLLFVDDEKQILKAIRRLFLDTDYIIYTAESGEGALQILDDINVDLIVVDMRMPAMNGYELLQRVKYEYPSTIRLILSGYADEKLITNALQNNLAKIYLFKPWENMSLVRMIDRALEVGEILNSERILKLSEFIEGNLLKNYCCLEKFFLDEQNTEIQKLLQRIDRSITWKSKIFSILNSSFIDVHINSMEEALNRFGKFNIKNIVLVGMLFEYKDENNQNVRIKSALEYAVLSNRITDLIYKRLLNKDLSEMNAVAGLMHGIGKYLYNGIQSISANVSKSTEVSYPELSGYILNKFGFAYPVIEAALFHHLPMDSRIINKEIVAIVHIAGYYSAALLGERQDWSLDESVFQHLGFTQKDCENVIDEIMPYIKLQLKTAVY